MGNLKNTSQSLQKALLEANTAINACALKTGLTKEQVLLCVSQKIKTKNTTKK